MNNQKNLYIDLHVLQTVPPSCINRDDTGSPKTAIYGGVTRARVSSQAWKKAMRDMFRERFPQEQVGLRTKRAVDLVASELEALGCERDREKLAAKALDAVGIKVKKENKTDVLLFLSKAQAHRLAELVLEGETDKQRYKDALKEWPSVDMALFGRMVASEASLNYDAAAQVAHSISTHEVQNEYDYFTAVDDCAPQDTSGAGHLGTVEFHSATLYRYAVLNVAELARSLHQDTPQAAAEFVRAFLLSMPTGKQNTFANRTVPDLAYVTLRQDQPVNLAGAFERPIRADGDGFVAASVEALSRYAEGIYASFAEQPKEAFCVGTAKGGEDLAPRVRLPELLMEIQSAVQEYCGGEEEK